MKRFSPFLAGMILALLPTVSFSQERRSAKGAHELSYSDDEGYIVLSKILGPAYEANGKKLMNIRRLAITPRDLDQCTSVSKDFQDAVADFKKEVSIKYAFEKKFSPSLKYELVTIVSFPGSTPTHPAPGKTTERTRNVDGIYYLSVVGFDKNKTHAVAYEKYLCGELCGQDGFYFLLKGKNGWEDAAGITGCGGGRIF